jgi:IS5 family transposase
VGEIESPEYKLQRLAQEAIRQNQHEKDGGLSLVCAVCTKEVIFKAALRSTAEREAREAGWRSDGVKSWCPEDVPERCTMSLACSKCPIKQTIRAWDPQDGYAKARLRGWVIIDDATCPKCSVKLITLQ